MESPASRFVAALLSQNPGGEVSQQGPYAFVASVPVGNLATTVVVLQVAGSTLELGEQVKALVERAVMGQPLHVVLVHAPGVDVSAPLLEQIKPLGLQMKQVGGWTWAPGEKAVSVRGPALKVVSAAAEQANAQPELSLSAVAETMHRDAALVGGFQDAVMQRRPLVSWAIAAACVVFFGLQYWWGSGLPVLAASRMGAEIPSRVLAGEWWRLFSVMLLHANVFHLAMNMLALLSFGPFLERLIGSGRYLALYVLSGLGGSLLSLTRGGDTIGVGASGGVWGLMVAGAVAVTWPRGLLPAPLALQLRQRAWTPVLINVVYSLQPGIDMLAHLGGGLAGGLLVLLLGRGGTEQKPLERSVPLSVLGAAAGLLLAASMGFALREGQPWQLIGKWELAPVQLEGAGLELSIPQGFQRKPDEQLGLWRWGGLEVTGVDLIVVVTEPLEPDLDLSLAWEEMLKELEQPLPGMHYSQGPKRVTLPSGQEALFSELIPDDKDDVRFLWQWWTLESGRRWVMVSANALNSTSDERKQQLVQIVDSLH